ncbi:ABC transporter permease subunit [Mycoplasma sp. 1458C]|uniref:ABC transporter permease subunit n=1 Tax=unclassified Mycoplasma TaxID=2683645 RepID=UPI003AAE9B83
MNKTTFISKLHKKTALKYALILFLIAFFLYALYNLNFFYTVQNPSWQNAWDNFKSIFSFASHNKELSANIWLINWNYFLITLKSVTIGTFFGFLLAIVTGYCSATNIHKHKYFPFLVKIILMLLRAFPVIVFILLFKNAFSAELASFIIYFWFTWLWMNRYIADLIESCSTKQYFRDLALGINKLQSFYKNIYQQVKIKFFLNFFLSYESNIRWLTILGLVGINGLGIVFADPKHYQDSFGITLLFIAMFILIIESILYLLNKILLVQKPQFQPTKQTIKCWKYNWKKYVLCLMLIGYFAVMIWGFISLADSKIYSITLKQYFANVFKFDFSSFNWGVMKQYFIILQQAYVSVVLAYILGVMYAYILAEKINKNYSVIASKIVLTFIKVVPTYFWFLVFNPLMDSVAAITVALVVSAFRKMTKQISESINTLPSNIIALYKVKGWSKLKIYRYYVLPYVNKQLLSVFIFQGEDAVRNSISYGTFANLGIYNLVLQYQDKNEYSKIFPVILPAYIFFIILEISFWIYKEKNIFIRNKINKNRTLTKISSHYIRFYSNL